MSVSGISSINFQDFQIQTLQSRMQQFRQEFQQLGQDLQSGNLSAAQADFASLQQLGPKSNSAQGTDSITQDLNLLAQDLKSGNLSASQQDVAKIQQDVQTQPVHAHHHHRGRGQAENNISQEFSQLGQALQSGDLAATQQAYKSLQQDFQTLSPTSGVAGSQAPSTSSSSGISVSA